MNNFTTAPIIVPWDFSEMSDKALKRAAEIAESLAQIEVIHVTPYPSVVEPGVVWGAYSEEDIAGNLERSFRKDVAPEYQSVRFTSWFGDPGSQIVRFAKEKKAGLIVVSSHGRRGIPRVLLGSVAERVVRLSPCPVLVLRE